MLRIGKRAIVSFPNFGHWSVRLQLLFKGRMPDTETLEYPWYNTPNIHLCTIRDFIELCTELGITIERFLAIDAGGKRSRTAHSTRRANLMAEQALFLLAFNGERDSSGAPVYPK
jgi:methionine biosynthesis protein MetW